MNFFFKINLDQLVKNYKNKVKRFLIKNITPYVFDFKAILYSFPFIFGFYQIIYFQYKSKSFYFLFEKSIPNKSKVSEKISWESFHLFKSKNFDIENIKKTDVYNDCLIIELKKNNCLSFIGLVEDKRIKTADNIKSFQYLIKVDDFLFFQDSLKSKKFKNEFLNSPNLEKFFYNLDELPLKIDEITKIKYDSQKLNYFELEKSKFFENFFLETKDFLFFEKKKLEFLNKKKFFISGIKDKLDIYNINNIPTENIFLKKQILKKQIYKYLYKKKLFFLDKNIENFNIFIPYNSKFSEIFGPFSNVEILQLTEPFLQRSKITTFFPRIVSGYQFPDLKKNDVCFILFNTSFLKKNKFLKIIFPFDPLLFLNKKNLFFSNKINLFYLSENKNGYQGLNLQKNKKDLLEKNIIFTKTKKNRYKNLLENINDISSTNLYSKLVFKKQEQILFLEEEELTINNKNNFQINSFYKKNFQQNNQKNFYFFSKTENFFNINRKKGKKNLYFFENWEPLTLSSWLFITQIYLSFFIIYIIIDFYKDYGKEFINYLLEFGNAYEIDFDEIKEQYFSDDPGYRIRKNIKKQLQDYIPSDSILSQLGEIIVFLENYSRYPERHGQTIVPKGILLGGPPGTGKTMLARIIAGEAKVPIIIQSGKLLIDPKEQGRGKIILEKMFNEARYLAPCIIFFDEFDSIGENRKNLVEINRKSRTKEEKQEERRKRFSPGQGPNLSSATESIEKTIEREQNELLLEQEKKKLKRRILNQLLIEMDGLKQIKGVLVIGATNRLNILDPALMRPGRFTKTIKINNPSKEERIQLLKFYGKNRKIERNISWDYLGNRTKGYSHAHIAAIMNVSCIQSILQKTSHTLETIEKGIDSLVATEKPTISKATQNSTRVVACYQAGKAISSKFFLRYKEKNIIFLELLPKRAKERYDQYLDPSFLKKQTRLGLESLIITLHFGKAAEFLLFNGNRKYQSAKLYHTDYGKKDFQLVQALLEYLIDDWYYFSTELLLRRTHEQNYDFVRDEYEEEHEKYKRIFSSRVENETQMKQIQALREERLSRAQKEAIQRLKAYSRTHEPRLQEWEYLKWWRSEIAKAIGVEERLVDDWYNYYIVEAEEYPRNIDWVAPDHFIHSNIFLKKISKKSQVNFNGLYQIERDYIMQGYAQNCLDFALRESEKMRPFLDYFTDRILKYGVLRQNEIEKILKTKKYLKKEDSKLDQCNENIDFYNNNIINNNKILERGWGPFSRKKNSKKIKINKFLKLTKKIESNLMK